MHLIRYQLGLASKLHQDHSSHSRDSVVTRSVRIKLNEQMDGQTKNITPSPTLLDGKGIKTFKRISNENCKLWYKKKINSVVTVAGICNSVDGDVFFDMPPWWRCRWGILVYQSVSRLELLIGNRWMSRLRDRPGCPGMH